MALVVSASPGKAVVHVAAGGSNTSRSPWRGDVVVVVVVVRVEVGAPTRTDSNVSVQPARAIAANSGGPRARTRAHLAPFVVRPA